MKGLSRRAFLYLVHRKMGGKDIADWSGTPVAGDLAAEMDGARINPVMGSVTETESDTSSCYLMTEDLAYNMIQHMSHSTANGMRHHVATIEVVRKVGTGFQIAFHNAIREPYGISLPRLSQRSLEELDGLVNHNGMGRTVNNFNNRVHCRDQVSWGHDGIPVIGILLIPRIHLTNGSDY